MPIRSKRPRNATAEQDAAQDEPGERADSLPSDPKRMRRLHSDVRVLLRFIRVYCEGQHSQATRRPTQLPTGALRALCPAPPSLCDECRKLLMHAIVKRCRCPMDPKPACKHCPDHCYAPRYRRQIRKVMGYSGRKLVLSGRLDYLLHLWR